MPRHSYRERDYTFGQVMLKLRTSIGLTQAGLAERLPPRGRVLEALEALWRRSLIERGQGASFTLQSVVMEYVTDALLDGGRSGGGVFADVDR
jgi:hypothetical protein